MMIFPELMLGVAHDRHRELVAEADRAHILRSARRRARLDSPSRGQAPRFAVDHQDLSPTRQMVVTSARGVGATVT